MTRSVSSIKKRCILAAILVIAAAAAVLIVLAMRERNELKLSEFKSGENYCYQGIPWKSDADTVEKMMKRSLEPILPPMYFNAGTVELDGHTASVEVEFTDGKQLSTVQFYFPSVMDEPSKDYSDIEKKALEAFEKQYGESDRNTDTMGVDGLYHRSSGWYSESEDGLVTILAVQARHNKQRVIDLLIATGEVPREIWENMEK